MYTTNSGIVLGSTAGAITLSSLLFTTLQGALLAICSILLLGLFIIFLTRKKKKEKKTNNVQPRTFGHYNFSTRAN